MSSPEEHPAADALRAAASAAAVGAAVGAARAISRRRAERPEEPETRSKPRPKSKSKPKAKPKPEPEAVADDQRVQEPRQEPESEPRPEEGTQGEPDARREEAQPSYSGPIDDLGGTVARAREVLRDLHGADAESVSSVARGENGWVVGLEVVELRRIPESTDVLATYEVELDEDGGLVRFARGRRYSRSESEHGGRS